MPRYSLRTLLLGLAIVATILGARLLGYWVLPPFGLAAVLWLFLMLYLAILSAQARSLNAKGADDPQDTQPK